LNSFLFINFTSRNLTFDKFLKRLQNLTELWADIHQALVSVFSSSRGVSHWKSASQGKREQSFNFGESQPWILKQ
jgi:hypothetical protein